MAKQYRNTYNGAVRTAHRPMGYPWVEVTETPVVEFGSRTAEAILADVGDDPVLAQAALDAESQREKPRSVLSGQLEKIIKDAESDD